MQQSVTNPLFPVCLVLAALLVWSEFRHRQDAREWAAERKRWEAFLRLRDDPAAESARVVLERQEGAPIEGKLPEKPKLTKEQAEAIVRATIERNAAMQRTEELAAKAGAGVLRMREKGL